jgi:hypothetical protein
LTSSPRDPIGGNPNESRDFSASILVELKEKNQHSSKVPGSWNISNEVASNRKLTASSSGYHYEFFYDVDA